MNICLKILDNAAGLELPSYATAGSAGMDLRAAISGDVLLKHGERKLVPTGLMVMIPHGYNGEIRSRSGLAYKSGITVLNSPGTIDSDYRGEIKVLLTNMGEEDFLVERGMRIAQLVVQKYESVNWSVSEDSLESTARSVGGFGSTGIK